MKKHGLTMPGSQTRESVALRIRIREATLTKTDSGVYEATVITEGPGNPEDDNYYTAQALREAVQQGLFEGLRAFANHPSATEAHDRPERDIRQLVGHFREARFIDGHPAEVRASFVPITGPGYEWVRSLVESAIDSMPGKPLIGISIPTATATRRTPRPSQARLPHGARVRAPRLRRHRHPDSDRRPVSPAPPRSTHHPAA